MRTLLLAAVALSCAAAPALAQTETDTQREVTVRMDNILQEMAAELDLPDALLPGEIDVPAAVAAEACGVDAAALAREAATQAGCVAVVGSPALTRFVQDEMVVSGRTIDQEIVEERPERQPVDPLRGPSAPGEDVLGSPDADALQADEPDARAPSAVIDGDAMDVAPSDLREQSGQPAQSGADRQPRPVAPSPGVGATDPADPGPSPSPGSG